MVIDFFLIEMVNYQVKNSCDKAIKFTMIRKIKNERHEDVQIKEDIIILPKSVRELTKLSGATIIFTCPVDITFRQKKALTDKLSLITRTVKESLDMVTSAQLPSIFTILKIKKIYDESQ